MRSSGIQLRVGDFLFTIQKRWKLIVALTLVGMLFGFLLSGVSYVQSSLQSVEVSGAFAINTLTNDLHLDGKENPAYNDFMLPPEMVDAVTYIVQSDRVLSEVIERRKIADMTAEDLRDMITLKQYNATQIVEMQVSWDNEEEGVGIWNALIDAANETVPRTLQLGSLSVINEPKALTAGVVGSSVKLLAALTILGFMTGLGFAVMELLMHPTLTNVKDVETVFGLETIGVIPRDNSYFRKKKSFLVQDDSDSSEVLQNYSAAAYILRNRLGPQEKHHCFYVTSSSAQEGKSTVAANLAIQLSAMECRTLLVDFDMRNPRLGSMFLQNVDYEHSFNALYRGDATIQEAVTTLTGYLDILPAVISSSMISMDSSIVELFDRLKKQYEYIIIDAPPVGEVSGTLSLNQVSDTALFVIGYDMATIPEIQNSLDKLDKTSILVLGAIVNAAQTGKAKGNGKDEAREYRKKKARQQAYFDPGVDRESFDSPEAGMAASSASRPGASAPSAPPPVRDAFADILDQPSADPGPNDQQMMTELLKLGIEGDFGAVDRSSHAAETPIPNAEHPADVHTESHSAASRHVRIEEDQPSNHEHSPAAAPSPEETYVFAVNQASRDNARTRRVRKKARAVLPIYILLAIPFTAFGVAILAAAAVALLYSSILGLALGINGFITTFQTYTVLADRLAAAGWSILVLVLGLALLWLFVLMLLKAIPSFVSAVVMHGRKWCFKEDQT